MEVLSPNSAVLAKTRELCSLILQSSEYSDNAAKVEAFFADAAAQDRYREFAAFGGELERRQSEGSLSDADMAEFEARREALESDAVVGGFLEAEAALNGIVKQISRHIGKTLELGRLPTAEELADGGCCSSGGCGCG